MRLLAVVLAGWACTGHGHPVHMTPTHQAGISGRGPEPKDSLASLLMVRGGMSGLDEGQTGYVRRGHSEIYDMKGRRTGRSWLDDVNQRRGYAKGGYVQRGSSEIYDMRDNRRRQSWLDEVNRRGGHARKESSGLDGVSGGYPKSGYVPRGHGNYHMRDRHTAPTKTWVDDVSSRRGYAEGGYVRRGHSEIYNMKNDRRSQSWLDDVNHGYVHRGTSRVGGVRGGSLESRPRTPSGSTTVKTATEDFRDANVRVGWAPEGGAVHETVRFPSRIRKSMDNYETEDFRDVHVRRGSTLQ